MRITACPKCGSRNIHMGKMKEGTLYGITSWNDTCQDCGYQGQPLVFDSEADYKLFLEELSNEKNQKPKTEKEIIQEEHSELSEKEKELLDFLNEPEETKKRQIEIANSKRLRNFITKLGATTMAVGILLTAATFGMYIVYSGTVILAGLIIFIVGIISPPDEMQFKLNTKNEGGVASRFSKPTIAGILLIMSGLLGFFGGISLIYFDTAQIDPALVSQISQEFGQEVSLDVIHSILMLCGTIFCILSIFPILGGIFAVRQKRWSAAILGGVIGLFIIGPQFSSMILALISLILLYFSKKDFR